MSLFEEYKAIRKKVSIKELSRLSGVPTSTLSAWEYGNVMPTIGNFLVVLGSLGYTLKICEIEKETPPCS